MESSILLTDEINIEQEKWELEQSSMPWSDIEKALNAKYRESSRKRMFRCQCCNSTTFLVLNQEKSCCFKHESKDVCAGSRNYTRYTTNTGQHENQKHRVGKAIIRDQLRVNLSRINAKIFDGYLFKEELKFVPDIVIEWPNGEFWTIDYVTGTRSGQYQTYLMKKQELYIAKKFKSYFLFDHSQIVNKLEQNALALSVGEKGSLRFLSRDYLWEGLLEDLVERFDDASLVVDRRLKIDNSQVYQLLYVTDDLNGLHYKISKLQLRQSAKLPEIPDRWYLIVGQVKPLTINELFTYDQEKHKFTWENVEVDSDELNEVVLSVHIRHEAILKEESDLEIKRIEKQMQHQANEESRLSDRSKQIRPFSIKNDGPISNWSSKDNYIRTEHEKIIYYKSVLDIMRISSLLESSPGFIDRIKDCDHAIQVFEDTGELSSRIHTYIRMMEYALNIE